MLAKQRLDPRVVRTRKLLYQALMTLLEEKHFNHITVGDIAACAGVNRTTFYDHFEDKNALVNYTIEQLFHSKIAAFVDTESGLSADNLQSLLLATCQFVNEFVSHCSPAELEGLPPIDKQIPKQLREVLTEWLGDPVVADVMSWTIHGAALHYSSKDNQLDLEQLADQVMPFLLLGLEGIRIRT